jgi:indolepyruvate ferredoxin oxidoreductase alpha subunit
MAERSFVEEVKKLRLGAGEVFRGEGILAVTKALLESGVAYVAGYQGAPISHLMDVLADAQDILAEHGIRFENSASEATAAATLAASVNYPLRGAVTFKSTVGTNVASDALANLASGGVTGGALIVVGEDYGEGSSIMQERSHAFAMKSQIWLLDPRPNLPSIVAAVKHGFALSEASHTPVMLQLRIRACHVHGEFVAGDNVKPAFTIRDALETPRRDTSRIVLPPAAFVHEQEKVRERWPAAVKYIEEQRLNEFFAEGADDIGIVVQGGSYNGLLRALERLGVADVYGNSRIPLYVMNVAYPVIDAEVLRFCEGKRAVLMVEEGQPNYIEQNIAAVLRQAGASAALHGKDMLPPAGEYTAAELLKGARAFLEAYGRVAKSEPIVVPSAAPKVIPLHKALAGDVNARPPGFCTGCPERPIFTAMKLVERELGVHHVSADIGCHLFSILPPFNLGNTTMGYGLGAAGAAAFNPPGGSAPDEAAPPAGAGPLPSRLAPPRGAASKASVGVRPSKRAISVMGDGGFWHNGLTSGIANAVFNKSDNLTIVVDNSYSAATGGQDLLSSSAANPTRSTGHAIEKAVRGVGVNWVKTMRRTYDVAGMVAVLKEALTTGERGPKVLIAQSECMLNKQRREKPLVKQAVAAGERVVRERFGVDSDTCTGDHSCIRLSGCPSLSVKPNPDPLRTDPVATVLDSCVGCGLCGEVADAAVLCPSFYKAQIVSNPTRWDRLRQRLRSKVIGTLQRREARARERYAF